MSNTTPRTSELPNSIGRYLIKAELGRGGFSIVYRAYDPSMNREVAIKVLKRTLLDDDQYRARFEREVKTVATLEFPAIVPVYDFGEENGQPFIVMRLMTGGSLNDRLKNGKIPLDVAIRIITRLAPALDYAHSRGVIHRDLKPDNILFDQFDNAYISDFGIARIVEATTELTVGGATIGTPAYMSPEQVQDGKSIDGRSDIYSLGVIFFEMLSGNPPYQSDTPAKVYVMHILEPVPSLLESLPELPPAIEIWLQTAMAKEPDKRFSTARGMADELQLACDPNTVVSLPQPIQQDKKTTPAKGFPRVVLLVILVTLAFGIGYTAFNYLGFPSVEVTPSVTATLPNLAEHPTDSPTKSTQTATLTETSITPTTIPPSDTASLSGLISETDDIDVSTATITPSPTQEPAEALTPTLSTESSTPLNVGGADKFTFVGGNEIWIANLDGSDARQLTSAGGGRKIGLQWTPDGQSVTYVTNKCVLAVDITTGQVSIIFCASWAEYIGAFQTSPDGSQVALSLSDGLYILPYNLEAISSIRTKQQLDNSEICTSYTGSETKAVRWSRDGNQFAVVALVTDQGRPSERIKVFRIDQCGRPPISIDEFPRSNDVMTEYQTNPVIADFDWDGETLFAMTVDRMRGYGEIYIYNLTSKRTEKIQPLEGWCCYLGFRWSPDGEYFLFAFQDIRYNNPPMIYNVIYGTIGSGVQYVPLPLPEYALTGENPHPAFRPAQ